MTTLKEALMAETERMDDELASEEKAPETTDEIKDAMTRLLVLLLQRGGIDTKSNLPIMFPRPT